MSKVIGIDLGRLAADRLIATPIHVDNVRKQESAAFVLRNGAMTLAANERMAFHVLVKWDEQFEPIRQCTENPRDIPATMEIDAGGGVI